MSPEKHHPGINRRSFLIAAGITCLSIFTRPASAFAAIIKWGTPLKKTVGGVTYTYKSGCSGGSDPCVYTQITASKTVSAGTMQARAIAIRETSLAIAAASNWISNSKGTSLTAKKENFCSHTRLFFSRPGKDQGYSGAAFLQPRQNSRRCPRASREREWTNTRHL